jgi:hypothetical protein
MRRTLLAMCAAAALLASACGSSGRHAAPDPTVATVPFSPSSSTTSTTIPPTTVAPTSTTTVPDTARVPRRITAAYVDAVLAKLNHVYGDAVRATVTARRLTPAAIADISAIYSHSLGAEEQKVFIETVSSGLGNVRRHPGDPIMTVRRLIEASPSCIYAKVQTNSDPEVIHPVAPLADEFIGLDRKQRGHHSVLNRTAWIFFFDITNKTPTNVPNQCPNV